MKYQIVNYRGCKEANFESESIIFLAGKNEMGKSSIVEGIAGALSGNMLAGYEGGAKTKIAKELLTDDAKTGMVQISNGESIVRVHLPSMEREEQGEVAHITEISLGMQSIARMALKDRYKFLCDNYNVEPTSEQLKDAIKEIGLNEKQFDELWRNVTVLGWDGAYDKAREVGAQAKGAWQQVTGEQYGKLKAENWQPSDYDPMLINATLESLEAQAMETKAQYEQALKNTAVDEAAIEHMKSLIEKLPEMLAESQKYDEGYDKCEIQLKEIEESLQSEKLTIIASQSCPKCGAALKVVNGKIIDSKTGMTKQKIEAIEKERNKLVTLKSKLLGEKEEFRRMAYEITSRLKEAQQAEKELKTVADRKTSESDLELATNNNTEAVYRLESFKKVKEAAKIHVRIQVNQVIVDALSRDGIRKTVLAENLGEINNRLEMISKKAGWGIVSIDETGEVWYTHENTASRRYRYCSKSGRYRVRATLQILECLDKRCGLAVFDDADMLDRVGRNGLVLTLHQFNIPSIVVMTMNDPKDMPPIENIGGNKFWVMNGVLST